MERRDGTGSPMAFLIRMLPEFLIVGTPALIATITAFYLTSESHKARDTRISSIIPHLPRNV